MAFVFPKRKQGRPSNKPSAEELAELYVSHTAEEIAEMYGVKAGTVYRWAYLYRKKYNTAAAEQETVQEET